jgi:hypothetical protein
VATILGDTLQRRHIGAADCPAGMNNASVPICQPAGASADNDCRTGSSAGTFCWPPGTGAFVYCIAGSGYGASSLSMPEPTGLDSGSSDSYPTGAAGSDPYSTLPDSSIPRRRTTEASLWASSRTRARAAVMAKVDVEA